MDFIEDMLLDFIEDMLLLALSFLSFFMWKTMGRKKLYCSKGNTDKETFVLDAEWSQRKRNQVQDLGLAAWRVLMPTCMASDHSLQFKHKNLIPLKFPGASTDSGGTSSKIYANRFIPCCTVQQGPFHSRSVFLNRLIFPRKIWIDAAFPLRCSQDLDWLTFWKSAPNFKF